MKRGGQVARVREGVFFATPEPLPRGRHGLTRDQVRESQRERLLIAMTELLADAGVGGVGPAEVARRAGVSLAAFYDCFPGKEDCVFAGYDRFIAVLLQQMLAVDASGLDRPALVRSMLGAYLDTLRSDLVVARAYQVEIDGLGARARAQRRESLLLFARHIREVADGLEGGSARALPESAYIGMVYAARQLASDALDVEPAPDFATLTAELTVWLADTFREQ
ncbi:TetR/AcrR family transcriptional regulator [Nocardioides daejeonensis]|uniref:TetR/AcrR family transcriptional regulator n=1 Tax=Nocardioides daejeonensis TaxID=1046556 RepID=UPI000D745F7F|nr:TetR/AcrR family transcriptional regulator [Nocardioides daejeonensis]